VILRSPLMASADYPTTQDLYARLKRPGEADEDLAIRLGVRLGAITRLKNGMSPQWEHVLVFLDAAGWLDLTNEREAELRSRLQEIRRAQEWAREALELLEKHQSNSTGRKRSSTTR
jgi:hypothetical protein